MRSDFDLWQVHQISKRPYGYHSGQVLSLASSLAELVLESLSLCLAGPLDKAVPTQLSAYLLSAKSVWSSGLETHPIESLIDLTSSNATRTTSLLALRLLSKICQSASAGDQLSPVLSHHALQLRSTLLLRLEQAPLAALRIAIVELLTQLARTQVLSTRSQQCHIF